MYIIIKLFIKKKILIKKLINNITQITKITFKIKNIYKNEKNFLYI